MEKVCIGIDFGTTNSLLTYYDPHEGPVPFETDTSENPGVTPTVLARNPRDSTFSIGLKAFRLPFLRREKEELRYFKLALPAAGPTARERRSSKVWRSTRQYLKLLIEDFRKMPGVNGIDSVVVTVPESWLTSLEQIGCDSLTEVFANLNLKNPRILSEPVAAGTYFAHRARRVRGTPFSGHVLVYDHGGGTLDVSLLRVDGNTVWRVDGEGIAPDLTSLGCGGVAFDERVFRRFFDKPEYGPSLRYLDAEQKADWLAKFEEGKRKAATRIAESFRSFITDQSQDDICFSFTCADQSVSVHISDLVAVFETHFQPRIEAEVRRFIAKCQKEVPDLQLESATHFRVVTVGGFSEFVLVETMLCDLFHEISGDPDVLESHFLWADKWLAISKGACLAAAGAVEVIPVCPFTFGVIGFDKGKPVRFPLVERGARDDTYSRFRPIAHPFSLGELSGATVRTIQFYHEQAEEPRILTLDEDFESLLPEFGRATTYRLGAMIKHGSVYVRIKPDRGRSKTIKIGQFAQILNEKADGREALNFSED